MVGCSDDNWSQYWYDGDFGSLWGTAAGDFGHGTTTVVHMQNTMRKIVTTVVHMQNTMMQIVHNDEDWYKSGAQVQL